MTKFANIRHPLTAIIFLLLILFSCTKNEPDEIQKDTFVKLFGDAYKNIATDFIKDGESYYLLGNTYNSEEKSTIRLIKTDEFGNRIWEHNFSKNDKQTLGYQLIKLKKQQGLAILGSIETDNDSLFYDIYLLIVDNNGNILWDKTYNKTNNEYGRCIAELDNGGFTLSAVSISKNQAEIDSLIFFPVNNTGEPELLFPTVIKGNDIYNICKKQDNNGYYITAINNSVPEIIIINKEGTKGGILKFSSIQGIITGITQDNSNNTYVCGTINNGKNGDNDAFIAKLKNADESIEYDWLKEFGKIGNDILNNITITSDNRILGVGNVENNILQTYNICILEADLNGNLISKNEFGGTDNEFGINIIDVNNKFVIEGISYLEKNCMITLLKGNFKPE
jgi:hypothetical protein